MAGQYNFTVCVGRNCPIKHFLAVNLQINVFLYMQLTPFQTLLLKVNAQPHLNMSLYSPTPEGLTNAVSAIVAHLTCKTTMTKSVFTECNLLRKTLSVIFQVPVSSLQLSWWPQTPCGSNTHSLVCSCWPLECSLTPRRSRQLCRHSPYQHTEVGFLLSDILLRTCKELLAQPNRIAVAASSPPLPPPWMCFALPINHSLVPPGSR